MLGVFDLLCIHSNCHSSLPTSCPRQNGPDGFPLERHPGLAGGAGGQAVGCDGPGRQVLVRPLRSDRHHQRQPGPAEGARGAWSRSFSGQTAARVCGGQIDAKDEAIIQLMEN